MALEYFVEKLRDMLKNPNALVLDGNSLFVFTRDCDLIEYSF